MVGVADRVERGLAIVQPFLHVYRVQTEFFQPVARGELLLLGAVQGKRLEFIKESETFYRWVLSTSSLTRMGDTLEPDSSADIAEAMDDEVFAQLSVAAESLLPDYPVDEDFDVFNDGTPHPRLIRAVRQSRDEDIWALIQRPELIGVQREFLGYMASNQIQSSLGLLWVKLI